MFTDAKMENASEVKVNAVSKISPHGALTCCVGGRCRDEFFVLQSRATNVFRGQKPDRLILHVQFNRR